MSKAWAVCYIALACRFIAVGATVYPNIRTVPDYQWSTEPRPLVLSVIVLGLAFAMGALGWNLILRGMSVGLPFEKVAQIWLVSQIAKYLPGGTVWYALGRIALGRNLGVGVSPLSIGVALENA